MLRKIILLIFGTILILIIVFYFFIGLEQYNLLYPHIDTKFSKDFCIKNFENIKPGMTKVQVENLLGEPLRLDENKYNYTDELITKKVKYFASYSSDGRYPLADYAWENFEVYYDENYLVVSKRQIWLND